MGMSIQNRSVLYKTTEPVLVPEGVYEAELVGVKDFSNAFGHRVGLVFKITTGQHEGVELMKHESNKVGKRYAAITQTFR